MVAQPHHPAVVGQDPVLHMPGIPGAFTALVLGQDPVAVLGMHQRLPEAGLHGFLGRVAQQPLVLRAVVDDRAAGCVDLGVEYRRDLFGQRLVALRRPGQPPLSLDPPGRGLTGGHPPR